ncbi:MAG: HD domain-containing protein [Armatimonadetes bacterium]|nr:HD domain-containing protein [Armatimonadota bacterium]
MEKSGTGSEPISAASPASVLVEAERELMVKLCELTAIVNSSLNITQVLNNVIDLAIGALKAERGFIMLVEEPEGSLRFSVGRNIEHENLLAGTLSVSQTAVMRVKETGAPVVTHDALRDARFDSSQSIRIMGICSILCAPMKTHDKLLGVIYLDSRKTVGQMYSEKDMQVLSAIANQAAIAVENANLYNKTIELYLGAVQCLAEAIEKKDVYTKGHCDRVREYSVKIAQEMKLSESQVKALELASILHDVGKIGVPEHILTKPGKLTPEEYDVIKKHPNHGYDIVLPINLPDDVRQGILHHQERYDGSGYPKGLRGEEIHIFGRIIAVADTFDAMSKPRVYRKEFPIPECISEIKRGSGVQFDPKVVEAFLSVLTKEGLTSPTSS